jgi:hypothetical protein
VDSVSVLWRSPGDFPGRSSLNPTLSGTAPIAWNSSTERVHHSRNVSLITITTKQNYFHTFVFFLVSSLTTLTKGTHYIVLPCVAMMHGLADLQRHRDFSTMRWREIVNDEVGFNRSYEQANVGNKDITSLSARKRINLLKNHRNHSHIW